MSDRELKAIISAKDSASPVFKAVASGADRMGDSVSKAGVKGSQGLLKSAEAADKFNVRAAAVGAAVATLSGYFADWNRSSQEAEAIQRQLEASIAATGESYSQYADRIAQAGEQAVQFGMDDEAASQAISALTQVTGSANTALENMGLVMDIAAAKHMSLEAAATLVGKVLGGNTALLNRQGFAIDENATAAEALAQVQQSVAGQAEASATTYGRLSEQLSNVTDSIGSQVGAISPLLSLLPGVSAGFSLAGAAAGAFVPELTAAKVASSALSLAMGPVGIIAAAGAAAIGIALLVDEMKDYQFNAKAAAAVTTDLENFFASMAGVMDGETAQALGSIKDQFLEIANTSLYNEGMRAELDYLTRQMSDTNEIIGYQSDLLKGLTEDQKVWLDGNKDGGLSFEELNGALQLYNASLRMTADQAGTVEAAITSLFSHTNLDAQKAQQEITAALTEFQQTGDVDALIAKVSGMSENWYLYADSAKVAAGATQELTDAQRLLASSTPAAIAAQNGAIVAGERYTAMAKDGVFVNGQLVGTVNSVAAANEKAAAAQELLAASTPEAIKQQKAQNTLAERWTALAQDGVYVDGQLVGSKKGVADAAAKEAEATKAATKAAIDYLGAQENIIDVMLKARSLPGNQRNLENVDDILNTQAAIESVFNTIVGGTDALGKSTDQIDKWATELIGAVGTEGKIDDLLKRGVITLDQYNRAQTAQTRIAENNAAVQDDLLSIQVRQAPFIEEQTRAYREQIDELAGLNVEQQRVALGFIDQGERAKIADAYATAYSASLGEMPKEVATEIILNQAEADPILKDVLLKYGLIEEGADGAITVNFDDAPTLTSAVEGLTGAVNNLTVSLSNIPSSVNTNITANDEASIAVANARMALAGLDGMTAQVFINVAQTGTNPATFGLGQGARLGGLLSFASGGMVELAEAGPEMLRFPTGGMAMAMSRGIYAVPDSTLVYNAPATKEKLARVGGPSFTFNNYGAISGFDGINEVMQAFKTAAREHFAGWRG
jgi:hypothetical protein